MTLTPGTQLGPYRVLALLGRGGMGEVYKAVDSRLDRTVAIKVLLQACSVTNPAARWRFEREARAISSLDHPHICTLYDVGCIKGVDFLVMQYIDGQTLASRIRSKSLALRQALDFGHPDR